MRDFWFPDFTIFPLRIGRSKPFVRTYPHSILLGFIPSGESSIHRSHDIILGSGRAYGHSSLDFIILDAFAAIHRFSAVKPRGE